MNDVAVRPCESGGTFANFSLSVARCVPGSTSRRGKKRARDASTTQNNRHKRRNTCVQSIGSQHRDDSNSNDSETERAMELMKQALHQQSQQKLNDSIVSSHQRIWNARGLNVGADRSHECRVNICDPCCERDMITLGRLAGPIVNPNVYVCKFGRIHVCTPETCEHTFYDVGVRTCKITGRQHGIKQSCFSRDNYMGEDAETYGGNGSDDDFSASDSGEFDEPGYGSVSYDSSVYQYKNRMLTPRGAENNATTACTASMIIKPVSLTRRNFMRRRSSSLHVNRSVSRQNSGNQQVFSLFSGDMDVSAMQPLPSTPTFGQRPLSAFEPEKIDAGPRQSSASASASASASSSSSQLSDYMNVNDNSPQKAQEPKQPVSLDQYFKSSAATQNNDNQNSKQRSKSGGRSKRSFSVSKSVNMSSNVEEARTIITCIITRTKNIILKSDTKADVTHTRTEQDTRNNSPLSVKDLIKIMYDQVSADGVYPNMITLLTIIANGNAQSGSKQKNIEATNTQQTKQDEASEERNRQTYAAECVVATWQTIHASSHVKRKCQKLCFSTFTKAFLYLLREGLTINGCQIIPIDQYIRAHIPPVNQLKDIGYTKKNINKYIAIVKSAYRSLMQERPLSEIQLNVGMRSSMTTVR